MAPLSPDFREEWDDDEDGEWEPPKIDNPAFKGEWSPRMIANPAYSGKWIARMIPNPDFVDNPDLYKYDNIGYVGASSCGTCVVKPRPPVISCCGWRRKLCIPVSTG